MSSRTAVVNTSPPAHPNASTSTTSPTRNSARPSRTASTTSRPTPAGSRSVDHDTSAFAVATLRRWWQTIGTQRYPDADRLLVCADGGGSNGYRIQAWKIELAKLAAETGLAITVCHLPPGTSKWNQIEHRLFSQITLNWRGRPLITHQVIVELISATTSSTGLRVHCVLDTEHYPTGIKYTNADVEALPITRHDFHGEWNYTITPDTP